MMGKRNRYPWLEMLAAFLLLLQTSACQLPVKTLCVDPEIAICYDTIGHALAHAVDGDTIEIFPHIYNENLYIKTNVSLVGVSEASSPAPWAVIRGSLSNAPVIHIMLGKTVHLTALEITGGNNSNVGGGGIVNSGVLYTTNVIVDHNSAVGYGGGILNTGALIMADSLVTNNNATGRPAYVELGKGGGIYNHQGVVTLTGTNVSYNTTDGWGGGIYTNGDLTITDGNISHNDSGGGGGLIAETVEHGQADTPIVRLERVTVDNNSGGYGGGLNNNNGAITLVNVTLSGNVAHARGGAILTSKNMSTSADAGNVTIYASTIAGNRSESGQGGGIADNVGMSPGSTVIVSSTIFADNEGGNCALSGQTTFQSWDYNISDDDSCNLPYHADLINTDPKLNPLALNAPGRVKTHALQTGSPAADHATEGCNTPVDARGVTRGLPCDAGAYEGTVEPLEPQIATAVVAVNATCRSGPGTGYAAMGYLNAGESHTISGRNADGTWLKLETCWVARNLLTTEDDLQFIPVLEVPPPPEPTSTSTVKPQTSCSSWTGPEACEAAGCKWNYSSAGPGFCK